MLYVYVCSCGAKAEAHRKVKDRRRSPRHCGRPMKLEITGGQLIIKPFEAYIAVGTDKRIVRSRTEHRDMLRQFGKVEIGNDASMAPPPASEGPSPGEIHHSYRDAEKLGAFE